MKPKRESNKISRREFGRRAALGGAAALVPAQLVSSIQEKPAASSEKAEPQPGQDDLSASARAEIEAKYNNVLRRRGDRLDDEQRRRVRQILTENQRMLEPIRQFPLANSDAPGPVLRFYTEEALGEAEQRATTAKRNN